VLKKLPTKDLDVLFCAKPKEDEKVRRKQGYEKPKELVLINPQRGNNVAIMLSRFKLPYTQLKKAMVTCDEEVCFSERHFFFLRLMTLILQGVCVGQIVDYETFPSKCGGGSDFDCVRRRSRNSGESRAIFLGNHEHPPFGRAI
jgi:hypothetical protein